MKVARNETAQVVVTGMGTHSAGGASVQQLWENTVRQIVRVEQRQISARRSCASYVAPEPVLPETMNKVVRHADRSVTLALAAARQAWDDAGLTNDSIDSERVGVIIGSSRGPAGVALANKRARPRVTDAVYTAFSSIAGVVAGQLGAARCAQMTSATCISAAVAVQFALYMLRNDELDVAIVGGVDAPLVDNLLEQFAAAGVVAQHADASALRPFDKERTGTAVGEGAAFIILERTADSRARGAKVHTAILSLSTGCEPRFRSSMSMNAQGMQATVRRALLAAGLDRADVDLLILHGTGTLMNDAMESGCVQELFGQVDQQPWSMATKAITGHPLGASSLFQLLVGVQAIQCGFVPGTANCAELDPECPIRLSLGKGNNASLQRGLCLTSGFWGNSSCIVFGKRQAC